MWFIVKCIQYFFRIIKSNLMWSNQYLSATMPLINSGKHNFLNLVFLLEYIQFPLPDLFPSCVRDHMFLFLQSVLSNLLTVFRVLHWLCTMFKTSREKQTELQKFEQTKVINVSLNENNREKSWALQIIKLLCQ